VTRPPAAAAVVVDADLAGAEQRGPRAAVGAVCEAGGAAELVGGQAFDVAVLIGEGSQRCQQQPRWSSGRAVAEHGLEQLDVDLVLLPRTELREQELDCAGVSAADAKRLDFE
jgi:hypothetical protein